MDILTIINHKSKYSTGSYPTFAINGIPLEVWLPEQNPSSELDLVSAHAGLNDDDEFRLVWDRIYSTAPEWQSIVPLLVCPDDLDLTCTVIVAEQCATEGSVIWKRFGLLRDLITLTEPAVEWYPDIRSVEFGRDNFMNTLDAFRAAVSIDLGWDG